MASLEENAAADPTYPCCSFQGSMQAVNAKTGVVLWKTLMLPDNHGQLGGFTGAGIWGSHAALDPATGHTLWQIADPSGGLDLADLSPANGVLCAGSMTGHMYAIDGATGEVLFDYLGDGSSIAGPAIVNRLRNLPFRDFEHNRVWLQLVLLAHDLIAWTQRLLLTGELARCEPKRLRYRLLHTAGRRSFHARTDTLCLQASWPWAEALAAAFARLNALPAPPG